MEIVIGGHFRLLNKLGSGCFGEIYLGMDDEGHPVALKLEPQSRHSILSHEAEIYRALKGGEAIPTLRWFGEQANYSVLVMDKLDRTLEELRDSCGGVLSLKTVLMLADQMISCLEFMHRRGIIHRDLKPENFMISSSSSHIFIIDFGLSKRYINPETLEHVPMSEHQSLTGTARYASINALRCLEQSRRDDLESLGYILVYLLKGRLPWQGLPAEDQRAKFRAIKDMKIGLPLPELCKDLPLEFQLFLESVRKLEFTDDPKYTSYRSMFRNLFLRRKFEYDFKYDWVKPPQLPKIPEPKSPVCVSVRDNARISVPVKVPNTRGRETGRRIADRILAGRASARRLTMPDSTPWRMRVQQRQGRY